MTDLKIVHMSRRRTRVSIKPTLFIACEGTSSEYQYFESWAQSIQALDIFERVNVYPDEKEDKPKTTPYELYERAKNEIDSGAANFAWIVFDKDNHPKLPETFADAAGADIKIAFSSRSFEEWVVMHFEKSITAFNATECKGVNDKPINCGSPLVPACTPINCLTGHIRRQNFIPGYSKKKTFDLYTAINKRTEIGLVNSAWLRSQIGASLNNMQLALHGLNPYTDVDQLILQFQGRSDKIEWGVTGADISFCNWMINASLVNGNIILQLSHSKPQGQILNAVFKTSFLTTDDDLNDTNCNVMNERLVSEANGSTQHVLYQGDIIEFTLSSNDQPYFLFRDKSNSTRIYITL